MNQAMLRVTTAVTVSQTLIPPSFSSVPRTPVIRIDWRHGRKVVNSCSSTGSA